MPMVIARIPSSRARWRRRTGGDAGGTVVAFTVQVTDDAGVTDQADLSITIMEG